MEPVRSTRNPRVAQAVRLRRARTRKESGLTLVEGPHLFAEATAAGAEIVTVFSTDPSPEETGGAEWVVVTPEVLARLSDTVTPQGPVAVMQVPESGPVRRDHLAVEVSDPGNAGTLIRTAAAFGLDVVFADDAVDPWSPKVLRAAAGGHFHTTIGSAPSGCGRIATVAHGGLPIHELPLVLDPDRIWAILIGSEAHGLDPDAVADADVRVTIRMPGGVESLNAAVAGAIMVYEFSRWRNGGGGQNPTR